MRATILMASIVIATAVPFPDGQNPGALSDLVVEEATIDLGPEVPFVPGVSGNGKIVVRVRNQGQHTIVAWAVRASVTDANGVVRGAGGGTDGYEYDVRVLPDSPVLQPGATYTIRLAGPARFEPVAVKATPEYAIFDDNSAVGDERSIEMQFAFRARQAAGWQFIERAIEEAPASAIAADDALRLLDAKIAGAPREIRDSAAGRQVPQRIRLALRPGSAEAARVLLEELRVEAPARHKAAASRSIRRR
jgi:hypothetical protein